MENTRNFCKSEGKVTNAFKNNEEPEKAFNGILRKITEIQGKFAKFL